VERSAPEIVVPAGRYLLFALIAGGGCLADLYSKHLIFHWRGMPGEQPIWWIWEGIVGIETSLNTGALFGLGSDRVLWFAALSTVALVGILVWFVAGRVGRDRGLTCVLACITAGILGNLYDRLGLWSIDGSGWPQIFAVRDWIRISYGSFVWPNFNIADSLLVCSAVFLVWYSYFAAPPTEPKGSTANASSVSGR
jgi:signal peptidase II